MLRDGIRRVITIILMIHLFCVFVLLTSDHPANMGVVERLATPVKSVDFSDYRCSRIVTEV